MDWYGSRVELSFLEYINNPEHIWRACIGVSYGTNMWQVGDLPEQNDTFNMLTTKAKMDMVSKKEQLSLPSVIEPYKVIPIINSACGASLSRVATNKKAILHRGW